MSDKMKLIMENWRMSEEQGYVEAWERIANQDPALAKEVAELVFEKGGGLKMHPHAVELDNRGKRLAGQMLSQQTGIEIDAWFSPVLPDDRPPGDRRAIEWKEFIDYALAEPMYDLHDTHGPKLPYPNPFKKSKPEAPSEPDYGPSYEDDITLQEIIDEEIDAYLEENSMGGGAMAFAHGVEENIDEGAPGKLPDPVGHKMTPGNPDGYTDKYGRYIPYTLDGCDLHLRDVPSLYPPNHKMYWKRDEHGEPTIPPETDPETGLPVNGPLEIRSIWERHKLHVWMCENPEASAPWPITAKEPYKGKISIGGGTPLRRGPETYDDPSAYIDEGVERPKGISLRVTTPDTLDEV